MLRLGMDIGVVALSIAATLGIVVGMLCDGTACSGYTWKTTFSYHPVFMAFSFVFFMALGMSSYVMEFEAFAKGGKFDRSCRRMAHGLLQLCAVGCAVAGYFVAFAVHQHAGKSQFAQDPGTSNTRKAHVYMGYGVLGLVLIQVCIGLFKVVQKAKPQPRNVAKWHGLAGPLVWALGMLVCMVGVAAVWLDHDKTHHAGVAATLFVLLGLLLVLVVMRILIMPRKEEAVKGGQSVRNPLGASLLASS